MHVFLALASISTGGRPIYNLRFAEDTDLTGGSDDEPQYLTNRLEERATAYGMEVSAEKIKVMTNSMNNISADICMNGQNLEGVTSFRKMGATLGKDATCKQKSASGLPPPLQQCPH